MPSFLRQRPQMFKYTNTYSEPLPVYIGILQDSINGLILFSLMVNNLEEDMTLRWNLRLKFTILKF
jgi:hypothetical protein